MNASLLVLLPLLVLAGCAVAPETSAVPRSMNQRALGYGVFLPSCVLFCVATGQSSQAEHGDAQAGDLTTTATMTPPHSQHPAKPKMKPRLIGKPAATPSQ